MSSEINLSKTFYDLEADWWMQIIDGDRHQQGPLVFDKDRPEHKGEPGYLKGITEGSSYAVEVLSTNDLSVDIYKTIHAKACSYFKEIDKSSSGSSAKPGVFRTNAVSESIDLFKWTTPEESKILEEYGLKGLVIRTALFDKKNQFDLDANNPLGNVPVAYNNLYPHKKWEDLGTDRDRYVNCCAGISRRVDALNRAANPYGAYFSATEWKIYLDFKSSDQMEESVLVLFKEFNEKIRTAATPKERLVLIADLFQKLEWRHPPQDGTTRTDLIVLNALLSKYGFNPAILNNPAYATFHLLNEWVSYLEQGMEAWKTEKLKPHDLLSTFQKYL